MRVISTLWLDAKQDPYIIDDLGIWIRKCVYNGADIIVENASYDEISKIVSRLKYETGKAYKCTYHGEESLAVRIHLNGELL